MTHRENTDWLRRVENKLGELTVQDDIHIEIKKVRRQIRKISNWKWYAGILDQKPEQLGNLVSNFRPITCLLLIWKLLTSILAEELYEHFKKGN